jgi:exodeoxyribonuclease-3
VPDSEQYQYKLAWLATLRDALAACPTEALMCGDMNVAPTDADVFDPSA